MTKPTTTYARQRTALIAPRPSRAERGKKASKPRFTGPNVVYVKRTATFHDDRVSLAATEGHAKADYVLADEDSDTPHSDVLTATLVGSHTFAGSVAAIDIELERELDIDQDTDTKTQQYRSVSQDNTANQGSNIAIGGTATTTAQQSNTNVQYVDTEAENNAEVDQEGDEFEVEDNVLLDF